MLTSGKGVGRLADGRRFGSGVLSTPSYQLAEVTEVTPSGMTKPVPLQLSWPGAFAVAEVRPVDGSTPVTAISFHTLFEAGGWGIRVAHRLVADLMYLFADRFSPRKRGPAKRIVLGGDFNITTQFDPPWDEHARALFRQLELFGFVNALASPAAERGRLAGCTCTDNPCPHFKTWHRRGQDGRKPRQNDYLYVTADLRQRLRDVEVLPIDQSLSEHAPIVADLEL
jgi:hypothetical protein